MPSERRIRTVQTAFLHFGKALLPNRQPALRASIRFSNPETISVLRLLIGKATPFGHCGLRFQTAFYP
jgi:hypothetical protein